jgi:hypothetical protein
MPLNILWWGLDFGIGRTAIMSPFEEKDKQVEPVLLPAQCRPSFWVRSKRHSSIVKENGST